ncbi:CehA/McbA family metallohydrolase [Candidatus Hydrogenedentota bacterium]
MHSSSIYVTVGLFIAVFIFGIVSVSQAHGMPVEEGISVSDLDQLKALFDQVSESVHHEDLNEQINTIHRQYKKFKAAQAKSNYTGRKRSKDRGPAPSPKDATNQAETLAKMAGKAYGLLSTLVPVVDITLEAGGAVKTAANEKGIISGRPEYILLSIRNEEDDGRAIQISGDFAGTQLPVEKITLNNSRKGWRLLQVQAKEAGPHSLKLDITSDSQKSSVEVTVEAAPHAILVGHISDDDTEELVPARVYVTGSDGRYYIPDGTYEKNMKPAHYDYAYGYFYGDREFQVVVPAGETNVHIERGFEYNTFDKAIELKAGAKTEASFQVSRWVDMVEEGWYSVDSHLHYVKYNWREEGDYDRLDMMKRAEDINVGHVLPLMHWWRNPDFVGITSHRYPPKPGLLEKYSSGRYVTAVGEEMRNNSFYGHLVLWNIDGLVEPVSTGTMGGPDAPDYPCNTMIADKTRAQGGYVSAAHDIGSEVPIMAINGRLDLVDLHRPDNWYHLLNCGFKLPCEIGSDYPANKMGFERAYVYTGNKEFVWEEFIKALITGRTFVSSGAVITFEADKKIPGDTIKLSGKGEQKLRIKAKARWQNPLQRLEIVHNGKVIKQIKPATPSTTLELDEEVTVPGKGWIAARCSANDHNHWWPVPGVAHTSAIYLDDGSGPYISRGSAQAMLAMVQKTLDRAKKGATFPSERARSKVIGIFEDAIAGYEELVSKGK